jgi:hypothetical protein
LKNEHNGTRQIKFVLFEIYKGWIQKSISGKLEATLHLKVSVLDVQIKLALNSLKVSFE